MTARIHKTFELLTGLHFNGRYYVNKYDFDLTMNVESESITEQNIALDRIKYYLHECLQDCVFVNQSDTDSIEKYMAADMNVSTLPEDPYDQVVGVMLMVKLNSITEGRLVITDLTIESNMSDGVSCLHSIEENIGPFNDKGWWNDVSQRINDYSPKNKKIVKLSKLKNDWQEVFLDWEEKGKFGKDAEIIFTSFDKTDK